MRFKNALGLVGRYHEVTGEVMPLPSEASHNGLTFSKIPGQQASHYIAQGSLHRYFNNGGPNDTDYTLSQVKQTLDDLQKQFSINPSQSKVINFEFGVNIKLPVGMDAQAFNKYLVSANFKAFEKLNPKRPGVGYIAEFNEFSIKIYDKGYQARTGATDLIRVEIKVNRARWLDQFGFIKGDDLLLTDLLNPANIKILGDILQNKISSLILTPRKVDLKQLTKKQIQTFYECRDARSWEEWNSRQRTRKKAQLKAIFEKVNQPDPVEMLAELVRNKWHEVTTEPTPTDQDKKPCKKATISNLIVDRFCVFLDLFKKRASVNRSGLKMCVVYLPRGPPHKRVRPIVLWLIAFKLMRKNRKEEPLYMKMYREQILKPKQKERFKEQQGRTAASRSGFYNSPGWKKVRLLRITNNPLCQHCEQRGFLNRATVVDHIKPVDLYPDLALDYNNTQSLCDFCHDLKTKADTREKNRAEKLANGRALMKDLETGPDPQGGSAKGT